jgi:hypothetical protein
MLIRMSMFYLETVISQVSIIKWKNDVTILRVSESMGESKVKYIHATFGKT